MKKIGLAISLYDKIKELETNINIVREYWTSHNDAFISVCCNDPQTIDDVKKLDVDNVVAGENILPLSKAHRRSRIFDCITKSISNCTSEFIVHFHSDAYALNPDAIEDIIAHMQAEKKHVAFRGRGLEFRSGKCIHGDADDHFVIFRREEVMRRNIFNDPGSRLEYFGVGNPESYLAYLIQKYYSPEETYWYSNMGENIVSPDVPSDPYYHDHVMHRSANPFNIDEKRLFFHIGNNIFVHELLGKYGLSKDLIEITTQSPITITPEIIRENDHHIEEWLNE